MLVLETAKEKFHFRLMNFCVMPTHIHLLLSPVKGSDLSKIMQWIKTRSSKSWNFIHGSTDHLWGDRYFARVVNTEDDFYRVMFYIDQNPIKAGLVTRIGDWQESGAFHIRSTLPAS
jgi:REP element-mobilizing transposase RayT